MTSHNSKKKYNLSLKFRNSLPLIFHIPAMTLIIGVMIFPIAYTIYISFHNWNLRRPLNRDFIGLKNYLNVISGSLYRFPRLYRRGTVKTQAVLVLFLLRLGVEHICESLLH